MASQSASLKSGPRSSAKSVSTDEAVTRFRAGCILSPRGDAVWFLGLPFLALAAALISQAWLPAVVIASTALWFDIPHHAATFLRVAAIPEDLRRFREQLVIGTIAVSCLVLAGLTWAPLTLLLVSTIWNHQHQLMQLHGFTRIYDFKGRTGTPETPRWDLALAIVLYGNLFLTAPLFVTFWVREVHRLVTPISASGVHAVQLLSWSGVAIFTTAYGLHVLRGLKNGHAINPYKYLFIACNYGVLYTVAWHTSSVLVYSVANVIMHGTQYIVVVHSYLHRKAADGTAAHRAAAWLTQPRHWLLYLAPLVAYAAAYQFLKGRPLDEFGFGLVHLADKYPAVPELGLGPLSLQSSTDVFLAALVNVPGLLHLYFDSFIWKVRDREVQTAL